MATKKTTAKKTAPKTAPKAAPEPEPVRTLSPEEVEKVTEQRIKEEEKVTFVIPIDPRFQADQQFWEHNVNGVTYRYPRGVPVQLPKSLADTFLRKLKMQQQSTIVIGQFAGVGKRLDY